FSASKIDRPASTTVIVIPGRSSESFCASIAEVMPPPMMQMSLSWTGMAVTAFSYMSRGPTPATCAFAAYAARLWLRRLSAQSRKWYGFSRCDLDRAAHFAVYLRAVTVVVGFAAPEIERHQIGDDVLSVWPARQRADTGLREGGVEQRAPRFRVERAP